MSEIRASDKKKLPESYRHFGGHEVIILNLIRFFHYQFFYSIFREISLS